MVDVGLALRNSSKGKLKYDRFWVEDGRTKEVLDSISKYSTKISVSINPLIFPAIIAENVQVSEVKNEKPTSNPLQDGTKEKPKPFTTITDAHFFELQSEMEQPIQEYEEERKQYIQNIFENKKSEFENHNLEVEKQIRQQYNLAKRKNELDARRRTGELQKLEESMMREAHEIEKLQREQHQRHVKKLSAKILEAEMKQKQAEEERKRRLKEQEELKSQLNTCLLEAKTFTSKAIEKLTSCEYLDHLSVPQDERVNQSTSLLHYINDIDLQSKDKELTIDDILNANLQVQRAYMLLQEISTDVDSAKIKASHSKEISAASSLSQENDNLKKNNESTGADQGTTTNKKDDIEISSEMPPVKNKDLYKADEKKIVSHFISPDAMEFYQKIMDNYKRVDAVVKSVRNDPKNKKYRFELQKAINVPINSLSSNSGSQIKTKINKLLSILTGKASETSGRNINSDSPIFIFCAYLAAKQFVEQGDTQISSQYSTAFPIAFAALGVWAKQPDFGQLLLGHFYDKCPFLVPYYPPKEENQTNEEYFQSLGYRLDDDGKIEEKYKFLHRISGYVRLYAAIIQSPLPPSINTPHPHGIEWGWKWLSRTLNLEPRPDITATVIYDFLDVAGYALQRAYGKQFNKMLHILCKDYFQKIKQVTPGGSGGPLERLEIFLQQCAKKGRISPPEGVLDASFWNR